MASTLRAVVAGPGRRQAVTRLALLILLLALPGLAGCNIPPRPVTPSLATVQPGESVYDIARRFNVPLRDLIELNALTPPYALQPGQVLRLPLPREYQVVSGDSLYAISRRFGVDSSELARLNNLSPPYTIFVGQRLRLPSGQGEALAEAPFQPPPPPRRPGSEAVVAAVPAAPGAASVGGAAGQGQTAGAPLVLGAPSRVGSASVTAVPLDPLPSGAPPAGPADGATAAGGAPPAVGAPAASPTPPAAASAPPGSVAPGSVAPAPGPALSGAAAAGAAATAAAAPPATPASPSAARPAGLPSSAAPPPRAGRRFQWPVAGEVVSTYGPKPDGLHNDGINIAAPAGTPVVAAENGVVAYAGNELRGYGNLLLIRHADGWVTAYAHTARILVQRGDQVRAGQQIATVGTSGSVGAPQLHFEIRQGTQAINPLEQLPARPRQPQRS